MSEEGANEGIELLRARIEELDSGIIRLMGERFAHVRLIGRWKAIAGGPADGDGPANDSERGAELPVLYLQAAQRAGLDPLLVLSVFEALQAHSRIIQSAQTAMTA